MYLPVELWLLWVIRFYLVSRPGDSDNALITEQMLPLESFSRDE